MAYIGDDKTELNQGTLLTPNDVIDTTTGGRLITGYIV